MKRTAAHVSALLVAAIGGMSVPALALSGVPLLTLFLITGSIVVLFASLYLCRYGSWLGGYLGTYLIGQHLIGWTMENPGGVLFGFHLFMVCVLIAAFVQSTGHRINVIRRGAFWLGLVVAPGIGGLLLQGEISDALLRILTVIILSLGVAILAQSPFRTLCGMAVGVGFALAITLLAASISPHWIDERLAGGVLAFLHPNLLGVFTCVFALVWFFIPGKAFLRGLVIICLIGVLVLTDSRTAILALGIGLVVGARTWDVRGLLLFLALCGGVVGAFHSVLTPRASDTDIFTGRTLIWAKGLEEWRASGPLGQIIGSTTGNGGKITLDDGREFVSHNAFIDAIVRGGLMGLVLFAVSLYMLLPRLRASLFPERNWRQSLALALLATGFATMLTEAWLVDGTVWWWVAAGEAILLDPLRNDSVQREELHPGAAVDPAARSMSPSLFQMPALPPWDTPRGLQ